MIVFRHEADGRAGTVLTTARIGRWAAGSVTVKELGPRQVAAGRLYVAPEWRGQRVARRLMLHVLSCWQHADIWLYAEPYIPPAGEIPGLPKPVLERFYASLGFRADVDATGQAAMVRPAKHSPGRSCV